MTLDPLDHRLKATRPSVWWIVTLTLIGMGLVAGAILGVTLLAVEPSTSTDGYFPSAFYDPFNAMVGSALGVAAALVLSLLLFVIRHVRRAARRSPKTQEIGR